MINFKVNKVRVIEKKMMKKNVQVYEYIYRFIFFLSFKKSKFEILAINFLKF